VADAVAGPAVDDAKLGGHGLQIAVVVGVLKAHLDGVVVHITDRQLGTDSVQPHRLELQIGHGAGGVLGQGLVDANGDFLPGDRLPFHDVRVQDLLDDVLAHGKHLLVLVCHLWYDRQQIMRRESDTLPAHESNASTCCERYRPGFVRFMSFLPRRRGQYCQKTRVGAEPGLSPEARELYSISGVLSTPCPSSRGSPQDWGITRSLADPAPPDGTGSPSPRRGRPSLPAGCAAPGPPVAPRSVLPGLPPPP